MPFPIGHAAIGFATHSVVSNDTGRLNKWKTALFIIVLSNLPDIDMIFGLILKGNGSAFHRGPTHSILFALVMAFMASGGSKFWSQIPAINFKTCFLLIFSHVIADRFLTTAPVSFFWPFEVSWSNGNTGLSEVIQSVIIDAREDIWILFVCTGIIMLVTNFRRSGLRNWGIKGLRD